MLLCPRCQREAPDGALFCPFCRTAILPPQGEGEASDPLIGQTIRDTYFVQEKIGSGGMGQVYKAIQINLDRPVALKLLRPWFHADPTIVQRFHREARASSKLHHPNVLAVLDFGQTEDGTLFMAMEYLPGRNLLSLLKDEFPLGERRVVHLCAQVLSALAEAHAAGIVHRDLKPENVMVESRRDEPDFAKVLDFGIAKIKEPGSREGQLTQTGMVCGTPDYMSPEQASLSPLDARSDLYSVGVVLYEMLTGRHPFLAATPPAMVQAHAVLPPPPMAERCPPGHRVSPALEALVMRALAKSPDDRFQTAEEMRRELLDCPLEPDLGEGALGPQRTGAVIQQRASAADAREPGRTRSGPGLPPASVRATAPTLLEDGASLQPEVSPPSMASRSEDGPPAPPDERELTPTEALFLESPPSTPTAAGPSAAPAPAQGPARRRSTLVLLGIGSLGIALLAAGGVLVVRRSAGLSTPRPLNPVEAVGLKDEAPRIPELEPQPAQNGPAAAAPWAEPEKPPVTAAPAPEAPAAGGQPLAAMEPPAGTLETKPISTPERKAAPKASVAAGQHGPATSAHSRGLKRKRFVAASTLGAAAAGAPGRATPPRATAQGAEPTQPAPAPTVPSDRREAFVTREVLGFQQSLGDPELKGRGRGLVDRARWLLEPNGTLTFAPVDKAPGFFPMTVRARREGNRVSFEGARTARATDGPAYVRISGDLALVAADPQLTVDLEFGRVLGSDGAQYEPTYRARARLRLAPE